MIDAILICFFFGTNPACFPTMLDKAFGWSYKMLSQTKDWQENENYIFHHERKLMKKAPSMEPFSNLFQICLTLNGIPNSIAIPFYVSGEVHEQSNNYK